MIRLSLLDCILLVLGNGSSAVECQCSWGGMMINAVTYLTEKAGSAVVSLRLRYWKDMFVTHVLREFELLWYTTTRFGISQHIYPYSRGPGPERHCPSHQSLRHLQATSDSSAPCQ